MFVSIYYKPSLFNAHTMILIVHIFMNANKVCLKQIYEQTMEIWVDSFLMQQTYQLYDQRERTEMKPFSSQSVDFWPSLKILNKLSADCIVLIVCKALSALCFWVLYLLSLPKPPQSSLWMSITPTVPPAIKLATIKQI